MDQKDCIRIDHSFVQVATLLLGEPYLGDDEPIKKSMNKLEAARRMVQWKIKLSQFDIEYHPKTAIKA